MVSKNLRKKPLLLELASFTARFADSTYGAKTTVTKKKWLKDALALALMQSVVTCNGGYRG